MLVLGLRQKQKPHRYLRPVQETSPFNPSSPYFPLLYPERQQERNPSFCPYFPGNQTGRNASKKFTTSGQTFMPTNFRSSCKAFRHSSSTNKAIPSSNRSCQDHLRTPSKPLLKIMSCYRNVHSCSHTIIFGYWVGPDIDDGWGYVEAFINPITRVLFNIPCFFSLCFGIFHRFIQDTLFVCVNNVQFVDENA
ncbi:hypothetical protein PS2_010378 [Malus domestica]